MVFAAAAILGQADAAGCSVDVDGHIDYTATTPDGLPRSNPDDTVYPGDAFRYSFEYGFSGRCIAPRVHGVTSQGIVYDTTGNGPRNVVGTGSIDGVGEILITESLECIKDQNGGRHEACGHLGMTVSASERRCLTDEQGTTTCRLVTITDSDAVHPTILAPDVRVSLGDIALLDHDGYNTVNRDGSRYPWDPIPIRYGAEFEWRNERAGTIAFAYDKVFSPLELEAELECDHTCSKNLTQPASPVGTGFASQVFDGSNGDGVSVYTAPSHGEAGLHTIYYTVTVHNMGRPIASAENSTKRLVVLYEPAYKYYPYMVLADGRLWSYDNRQGVAIHYMGSAGTGPDDKPGLHQDRRSKINGFESSTIITSDFASVDDITTKSDFMRWSDVSESLRGEDGPFHSTGDHAVFYGSGYGSVRFAQNITDIIDEDSAFLYKDVITTNTLKSDMWAGNESTDLFTYVYAYPHAIFSRWFNMTADSDVPLSIAFGPPEDAASLDDLDTGEFVEIYLDDYIVEKIVHDTADDMFASIVLNDTYTTENLVERVQSLSVWVNKTTLSISDTIAAMYGYERSKTGILQVPMHHILSLPSDLTLRVMVGGIGRNVTIPFDLEYIYHERVFTTPQKVEYRRDGLDGTSSVVLFRTDEGFGPLETVTVNGTLAQHHGTICIEWCSVFVGSKAASVAVFNVYDGIIEFTVPAADSKSSEAPDEWVSAEILHTFLMIAAASGIMYLTIRAVQRVKLD